MKAGRRGPGRGRPDGRGSGRPTGHGGARDRPAARPRGARDAAFDALCAFAVDREVRVDAALDARDLPARDRALANEIARGVVRRQSLLDHVLAGFCERGLPEAPDLLTALRIGAYQLLFLDRVPPHAAVDESVRLADTHRRGFVNAVLRKVAGSVEAGPADPARPTDQVPLGVERRLRLREPLADPEVDLAAYLATVFGLPSFLLERWIVTHGRDGARALAEASDRTPGVHLRPVGIDRDGLAAQLSADGVETEAGDHPRLLRWVGGGSPFVTRSFLDGGFVVQDPTAVRAAEAVGARIGETVLDLCAAPGTKATLLAEAVGPTGKVYAHDVDSKRRGLIVENAARLHMPWIRIVETLSNVPVEVDRVLVDVPCSNTGVLARRVEVRHRIDAAAIASLARLQRELLAQGLDAVRPGGTVVYTTCSIEPEEGDAVVDAVVATRPDFEVRSRSQTLPDPPRHDGGYCAVLVRSGG